ncbi:cytochrome c [Marinobacterium zhoushanense]|uniref:Cytochrome c n=1 Tax=Marinobacterium zhoushanense TaxID=1679163 RepID=A0ABQ1KSP3_9GAMM|nr:cytochrome c [Marinobacterium zhoushanense]GGC04151.1 cytochrome c [Marinobacterium zhoushanense]
MIITRRGGAFAALLLTTALAQAAGDVDRGATIVMQGDGQGGAPCLACHGSDGAGNDGAGFPRLAGLDAGYLAAQLRDYREGRRISAVMAPNASRLNDQQIEDVAAYYTVQTLAVTPAELPADLLAKGEQLVKQGDWDNYIVPCETCHGPGAQGVGATFPGLSGQHSTYLRQQLEAWKNGTRNNDPNQLMLAIAARLSDEQIQAVSAYLSQQPTRRVSP